MKKYHIFESLFLSFYSKPLYQDVAKEWRGLALGYLLLVIAICWLPYSYDFHRFINQFSSQMLPGIVQQFPNITIKAGQLSIDRPLPYAIKEPGNGATLILFDVAEKHPSMDKLDAYALVTQNKVMVRDDSSPVHKVTTYSLAKLDDTALTQSQIKTFGERFVLASSILMYPLAVLISFVYRLLQVLIFGALGLVFAHLFQIKLLYKTSVRLAVVALTPMLFLSTLVDYLGLFRLAHIWLFGLLAVGYLAYAVHAQKEVEGQA